MQHHGRGLHPPLSPLAHLGEPGPGDPDRLGIGLCPLVLYMEVGSGDVALRRREVVSRPGEAARALVRASSKTLCDLALLASRFLRPIIIGVERLRAWSYPAVRTPINVLPYCFFRAAFSTNAVIRRAFDLYFSPRHVQPPPSFSMSPILIPMSTMAGSS